MEQHQLKPRRYNSLLTCESKTLHYSNTNFSDSLSRSVHPLMIQFLNTFYLIFHFSFISLMKNITVPFQIHNSPLTITLFSQSSKVYQYSAHGPKLKKSLTGTNFQPMYTQKLNYRKLSFTLPKSSNKQLQISHSNFFKFIKIA